MAILKFLFFLILLAVFVVLLMGATVVARIVHAVRKAFRGESNQQTGRSGYGYGNRHETYGDEEKVIDKRTPQEANRKIFADNEGEYVDFEETPSETIDK